MAERRASSKPLDLGVDLVLVEVEAQDVVAGVGHRHGAADGDAARDAESFEDPHLAAARFNSLPRSARRSGR